MSYKPDVDDVRESPAFDIAQILMQRGATVDYHDPYVAHVVVDDREFASQELTEKCLSGADAVVITTDHRVVDYGFVTEHAAIVVDPRNAISQTRGATIYPIAGPPRMPEESAVPV